MPGKGTTGGVAYLPIAREGLARHVTATLVPHAKFSTILDSDLVRMKIRLAINAASMRPSGGLTVMMGLLRAWQAYSEELDICVYGTDERTIAAVREVPGVECIEVQPRGVMGLYLWQNAVLGRELRRKGTDILLTNNHYLFNIPCKQIVYHHNAWRYIKQLDLKRQRFSFANYVRDWAARKALRSADRNVFVSDYVRSLAEREVPPRDARNITIRNAVSDDAIVDSIDQRDGRPASSQLLVLQSANVHKDNPVVLHTVVELLKRAPHIDWQVKIAGSDGRGSHSPLRLMAQDLGVSDHVDWLGFRSHEQLNPLFQESLCLLSTSILEAGPLPIIESMARGCPPVAARIPAVEEFAADSAILVEPHRSDLFAEEIIRLHNHPELRRELATRGLQRAREFTWSNRARAFYALFCELTGHTPRDMSAP